MPTGYVFKEEDFDNDAGNYGHGDLIIVHKPGGETVVYGVGLTWVKSEGSTINPGGSGYVNSYIGDKCIPTFPYEVGLDSWGNRYTAEKTLEVIG